MRKVYVLLLVAVLITVSSTSVMAQGFFGAKSLITIPTTDNLREGQINASYNYFYGTGNNIIALNYGLADIAQLGINLETDFTDVSYPYPTLKLKITDEEEVMPAITAGIIGRDRFLTASKVLPYEDIRVHLGIGDKERFGDYLFIGADKVLNPVSIDTGDSSFELPLTTVMAEYNAGLNLGFNFKFNEEFELDIVGVDLVNKSRDFGFKVSFTSLF